VADAGPSNRQEAQAEAGPNGGQQEEVEAGTGDGQRKPAGDGSKKKAKQATSGQPVELQRSQRKRSA